jgi:glycosyltransferase involved in cell wall biosynthesis
MDVKSSPSVDSRRKRAQVMKVSILCAVHNEERFIPQMLTSVRSQSHPDWELLVVDDGSSDNTPAHVSGAAAADTRVKLVSHGRKIGKVRAFNRAYHASTGDIVVLLAGDDYLPVDSLSARVAALSSVASTTRAVAFFKLRTVSENPRFDGMVLPRGGSSSRSGGCITLTRALADDVFPIDETLVSEDIWLAFAAVARASLVINRPSIVLNYRIHEGNSNPRSLPFSQMSASMRARHLAYSALLSAKSLELSPSSRRDLEALETAERFRQRGQTLRLLFETAIPVLDRAAMASMSNPTLYAVRSRFYSFFSGRQGR